MKKISSKPKVSKMASADSTMGGLVAMKKPALVSSGPQVLYSQPTDLYKPISVNPRAGAIQTAALVHMNTMNALSDRARRNMLGNIASVNKNVENMVENHPRTGGIPNIN